MMWYSLKQASTCATGSFASGSRSTGLLHAVRMLGERCNFLRSAASVPRPPSPVLRSPVSVARPGVTLIEVIFSIGIILIGMVGLIAVLPLAGSRARNSVALNTGTALADAAFDQLVAGGYLNPEMLIRINAPTTPVALNESICIDPVLAATHFSSALTFKHGYFPANFPHFQPNYSPQLDPSHSDSLNGPVGQPRMTRVGVRRSPGGTSLNLEESLKLVDSHDDVATERPKDRTLNAYVRGFPAVTTSPGGPLAYGKRLVTGEYSWIATLNPQSARPNERFGLLSVVVIRNRDRGFVYPDNLDPDLPAPSPEANANSERLARVSSNPGEAPMGFIGGAGGLVTLIGSARMSGTVNENHWVMLSRVVVPGTPDRQLHRWYRVASTDGDPIIDTSNEEHPTWQRRVYLDGSDWPFDSTGTYPTFATIVEGVVSVTERVVRIRDF